MTGTKTRLKKKQELDYILNNIFQLEEDHPMQLILRGSGRVTDVETILDMDKESLMSFKHFKEGEKEPMCLNKAEMSLIRVLKGAFGI